MFLITPSLYSLLTFLCLWPLYCSLWIHYHISWTLILLPFSLKYTCDYTGFTQMIRGDLLISRSLVESHQQSPLCHARNHIHGFLRLVHVPIGKDSLWWPWSWRTGAPAPLQWPMTQKAELISEQESLHRLRLWSGLHRTWHFESKCAFTCWSQLKKKTTICNL